jgi:hypothetical protein
LRKQNEKISQCSSVVDIHAAIGAMSIKVTFLLKISQEEPYIIAKTPVRILMGILQEFCILMVNITRQYRMLDFVYLD